MLIKPMEINAIILVCILLTLLGTPLRTRRNDPNRGVFVSQNSSVTEAPSDEVEAEPEPDDEPEPARVTQ